MGKFIVVQPDIREYRIPFFNRVSESLNGGLEVVIYKDAPVPEDANFKYSKSSSMLNAYRSNIEKDCVIVVPGLVKSISFWAILIGSFVRKKKVVVWTHGFADKGGVKLEKIGNKILAYLSSHLMLYYPITEKIKSDKISYIGNSCSTNEFSFISDERDRKKCMVLGNETAKSEHHSTLLFVKENGFDKVYVVGEVSDETKRMFCDDIYEYSGKNTDEKEISKIASKCTYGIYLGNIGLTLHHYLTLGLIPVIHDRLSQHMPEISVLKGIKYYEATGKGSGFLPNCFDLNIGGVFSDDKIIKRCVVALELVNRKNLLADAQANRFVEVVTQVSKQ